MCNEKSSFFCVSQSIFYYFTKNFLVSPLEVFMILRPFTGAEILRPSTVKYSAFFFVLFVMLLMPSVMLPFVSSTYDFTMAVGIISPSISFSDRTLPNPVMYLPSPVMPVTVWKPLSSYSASSSSEPYTSFNSLGWSSPAFSMIALRGSNHWPVVYPTTVPSLLTAVGVTLVPASIPWLPSMVIILSSLFSMS